MSSEAISLIQEGTTMIRILLVDDHPVVREGLAAVLADEPGFRVVGQVDSGERALREMEVELPDVVVLDLRLYGMSGIQTCESIRLRWPSVRVIILTSFPNEGALMSAFTAGARGFVLKESEPTILRQAVRAVGAGETYADPRVASKLVSLATKGRRTTGPFGLSLQQMRVLERLPRGLTNREIAEDMGVSENTVKTHLSAAMQKLKARDRAEAAAIALREGLA